MPKIKDIMNCSVIAVGPDADIQQVVRLLIDNNITGLPVIGDDNQLLGIISEKDILGLLYNFEENRFSVSDCMTADPQACDINDDISVAVNLLSNNDFRRIPIMNGGKIAGIVSRKDILKYIYDSIVQ